MELTWGELQQLGQEAGLDAIGATTAEPFPELESRLVDYAARGRTGYEYEDISVRVNPKQWLPEAKSVISAAMAYLTPAGKKAARSHPSGGMFGNVSVYSYGEDYHTVMLQRLHALHRLLEQRLGRSIVARAVVDTSPLVDRRVAERAGIGWVGKNCMLYTPEHGSFVFLGALLVDVDIEPASAEQPWRCEGCSRCLDACPTGALIAPGVIDATRCLSYVTQMKGIIPLEFRAALGRRVWGCDTCQWACPENQSVQPSEHEEYLPMEELCYPDLIAILHLSQREFQRRYKSSAAAWRGLRTWQRNALIALGNLKNPLAVDHIVPFLRHDRRELRASAAWALQQIDHPIGRQAVQDALAGENDHEVRDDMQWAEAKVDSDI